MCEVCGKRSVLNYGETIFGETIFFYGIAIHKSGTPEIDKICS